MSRGVVSVSAIPRKMLSSRRPMASSGCQPVSASTCQTMFGAFEVTARHRAAVVVGVGVARGHQVGPDSRCVVAHEEREQHRHPEALCLRDDVVHRRPRGAERRGERRLGEEVLSGNVLVLHPFVLDADAVRGDVDGIEPARRERLERVRDLGVGQVLCHPPRREAPHEVGVAELVDDLAPGDGGRPRGPRIGRCQRAGDRRRSTRHRVRHDGRPERVAVVATVGGTGVVGAFVIVGGAVVAGVSVVLSAAVVAAGASARSTPPLHAATASKEASASHRRDAAQVQVSSPRSSAAMIRPAASISARWEKACGKFPRW